MKSIRINLAALLLGAICLLGGSIAHAGAASDYLENKQVDWLIRGQAYTPPANHHLALGTNTCSDAGAPTEPVGNAYSRVAVAASLANWAGTQSTGSTTASTGTGGTTSNNNAITWSASTGAWGNLQSVWFMDASTSGNALYCINLTASLNVSGSGFTVAFPAAALSVQVDN